MEGLARSSEALDQILEASPAVTYVLVREGVDWRPVYLSGNLLRCFGHRWPDAMAPGWWWDHLHPED